MLLEAGADVNAIASDGLTPLFAAASMGHPSIALALINAGADVNIQSKVKRAK